MDPWITLGVGIGSDRFGGELSLTGEQLDDRIDPETVSVDEVQGVLCDGPLST